MDTDVTPFHPKIEAELQIKGLEIKILKQNG